MNKKKSNNRKKKFKNNKINRIYRFQKLSLFIYYR